LEFSFLAGLVSPAAHPFGSTQRSNECSVIPNPGNSVFPGLEILVKIKSYLFG
jgi:hypothetical protein